jgi:AcrR family transcriptional regulator
MQNNSSEATEKQEVIPTRQRILNSAAALFATKGYTETSIRELATAAGLQGSSIYNHFQSKNAILEYMLDDYVQVNSGAFFGKSAHPILVENPTTEGILSCLQLSFPSGMVDYYLKVLSMLLQEQHRNPIVREFMQGNIFQHEKNTKTIIDILKELRVIRHDIDPDYWMKLVSCIFYTFSNRSVMGIGDASQDYAGMGMIELLKNVFDRMFKECGTGQ